MSKGTASFAVTVARAPQVPDRVIGLTLDARHAGRVGPRALRPPMR